MSKTGCDAPADARSDARSSLTLRYRYRFANATLSVTHPLFSRNCYA
ncbi:hypothetical protein [Nostoc sp. NZL]|nr:hypothetical protein [Nostoc sp. NZL]